jgi:hypothetical protein
MPFDNGAIIFTASLLFFLVIKGGQILDLDLRPDIVDGKVIIPRSKSFRVTVDRAAGDV